METLDEGIQKASGNGEYRFSLRQLYYVIRPFLLDEGQVLTYEWFTNIVTAYGSAQGDIKGIYRDPRGIIYHPHLKKDILPGTLEVEKYSRPEWTFNKVLYCEKEGFFHFKTGSMAEKNDCALMSAKSYASRAARDIIDYLGETEEELTFFCIHDADAYGTSIYQALQEATKARPERKVTIINLGLEPEEALEMGLEVEPVDKKDKKHAVADYVEPYWREWLQTNRVELNAMTTPQFIQWLNLKMEQYGNGKIIPPFVKLLNMLMY